MGEGQNKSEMLCSKYFYHASKEHIILKLFFEVANEIVSFFLFKLYGNIHLINTLV